MSTCAEFPSSLTQALYSDLRRIAARHLSSERPDHTLQPTALVHEAYIKLAAVRERCFADGVHFVSVASRVMRQVLVDHARARSAQKRHAIPERRAEGGPDLAQVIEIDREIRALAEEDESLARLIEMRYFGGMTAEECAEALGMSVHTVRHDLRYAEARLRRALAG
jgi:RNA polymerase sigma-70 factor (ECF subfamily)